MYFEIFNTIYTLDMISTLSKAQSTQKMKLGDEICLKTAAKTRDFEKSDLIIGYGDSFFETL